jgi:hypothetical protein
MERNTNEKIITKNTCVFIRLQKKTNMLLAT